MNLLPHKSWNVWSTKNIAKVKEDERKFEEEQKKKRKYQQSIEQEARYNLLKERSKKPKNRSDDDTDGGASSTSAASSASTSTSTSTSTSKKVKREEEEEEEPKHINLFEGITDMEVLFKNPEYEAEKKAKEEKEKKMSTAYLGQTALETKERPPWWFNVTSKYINSLKGAATGEGESSVEVYPNLTPAQKDRQEARKALLDPMSSMNKYLEQAKKQKEAQKQEEEERKREIERAIKQEARRKEFGSNRNSRSRNDSHHHHSHHHRHSDRERSRDNERSRPYNEGYNRPPRDSARQRYSVGDNY